ncbi:class II aldolase/adducin family protein [Phyllobacterium sp. 21LDTY02-6]|uniref:class II aldolase/adducin family protein n=1 Tax=Phyllobacterium sp. 21LDTY02-6 TaxID=2944903 RepID=UPI002021E113|nr:class II aldolase/adducin family protein [Phyllobacterium sp. 21LDTY02-6]MCO4318545.1 class II aldolase/adducin family protein [Phyllobacterium sp. 21LDTY02-6]
MNSEFEALLDLSARVGADPALVQGAGGNTSIKQDGVLWIKASGLWLRDARSRDIMVPVALQPLLDAVAGDDPSAEKAQQYVLDDRNPSGLRPSIETTVHALMPQKVVVHVHCTATIAHAVQENAEELVASRLAGIPHAFVPYARPGLPLARAIAARIRPGTSVLVLGNHGLAVAAETVGAAEALLADMSRRLALPARPPRPADLAALQRLAAGSGYRLPDDEAIHHVATDETSCAFAAGGSLYPDHVIFLGKGSLLAGEAVHSLEDEAKRNGAALPPALLFPGKGVLVAADASAGALALARCLSDVTARIPQGARLRYLTDAENAELLGWDAEKYRQTLNLAAGAAR